MCSKKNKKPMYCIKCGTKQEEGEKFCPKCGTPFIVESESKSETNLKQEANNDFKVRFKKGLYVAFSLIVPLLGLILYFIKRKKDKKLAKSILICTIIGAAFNVVIYYNNYDDEFESSYYESNNESYETPTSDMQDEKLAKVLKRIAGDYELCENLGVQGFNVWSTMRINSDGTELTIMEIK